jgi:hypothetical protein
MRLTLRLLLKFMSAVYQTQSHQDLDPRVQTKTKSAYRLNGAPLHMLMRNMNVGKLLDISRVITGKLKINPRPIDVRTSLDTAIDSFSYRRCRSVATGLPRRYKVAPSVL